MPAHEYRYFPWYYVLPMRATIHYTIPAPEDNAIGGAAIAEVALNRLGYEFGHAWSKMVGKGRLELPRLIGT